jgi:hypothetical protein
MKMARVKRHDGSYHMTEIKDADLNKHCNTVQATNHLGHPIRGHLAFERLLKLPNPDETDGSMSATLTRGYHSKMFDAIQSELSSPSPNAYITRARRVLKAHQENHKHQIKGRNMISKYYILNGSVPHPMKKELVAYLRTCGKAGYIGISTQHKTRRETHAKKTAAASASLTGPPTNKAFFSDCSQAMYAAFAAEEKKGNQVLDVPLCAFTAMGNYQLPNDTNQSWNEMLHQIASHKRNPKYLSQNMRAMLKEASTFESFLITSIKTTAGWFELETRMWRPKEPSAKTTGTNLQQTAKKFSYVDRGPTRKRSRQAQPKQNTTHTTQHPGKPLMDEFLNLHCQLKRNGNAKQWEIKHHERKKKNTTTANQKETWAATPPENFINGLTDTQVYNWLEYARGSSGMTHTEQATLSPRSQLRLKQLLKNSLAYKVGSSPLTTSTHPPQFWITYVNPACAHMAAPDQVIKALTQTPLFSIFPSILNELEVRFTQLRPTCPTMTYKMHQKPIQTEHTCPCDKFHDSYKQTLLIPPTTQTQTGSLLITGKATPQRHVYTSNMSILTDKRNTAWKFTPHQALETRNKIHEGLRCVRDPSISPPQHLLILEQDITNFLSKIRRSHLLPNSAWQKCYVKNAAQKLLAFAYEQESLAPTHPQPTKDYTTQNKHIVKTATTTLVGMPVEKDTQSTGLACPLAAALLLRAELAQDHYQHICPVGAAPEQQIRNDIQNVINSIPPVKKLQRLRNQHRKHKNKKSAQLRHYITGKEPTQNTSEVRPFPERRGHMKIKTNKATMRHVSAAWWDPMDELSLLIAKTERFLSPWHEAEFYNQLFANPQAETGTHFNTSELARLQKLKPDKPSWNIYSQQEAIAAIDRVNKTRLQTPRNARPPLHAATLDFERLFDCCSLETGQIAHKTRMQYLESTLQHPYVKITINPAQLSYDVQWSLPPSPQDVSTENETILSLEEYDQLVTWATNRCYVTLEGQLYLQIRGVGLGSRMSPEIAMQMLQHLEGKWISELVARKEWQVLHQIKHCMIRSMDDILVLEGNPDLIKVLTGNKQVYSKDNLGMTLPIPYPPSQLTLNLEDTLMKKPNTEHPLRTNKRKSMSYLSIELYADERNRLYAYRPLDKRCKKSLDATPLPQGIPASSMVPPATKTNTLYARLIDFARDSSSMYHFTEAAANKILEMQRSGHASEGLNKQLAKYCKTQRKWKHHTKNGGTSLFHLVSLKTKSKQNKPLHLFEQRNSRQNFLPPSTYQPQQPPTQRTKIPSHKDLNKPSRQPLQTWTTKGWQKIIIEHLPRTNKARILNTKTLSLLLPDCNLRSPITKLREGQFTTANGKNLTIRKALTR